VKLGTLQSDDFYEYYPGPGVKDLIFYVLDPIPPILH
jgi:hypothetical protein